VKDCPAFGIREVLSNRNTHVINEFNVDLVSGTAVILKGHPDQDLDAGGMGRHRVLGHTNCGKPQ
jgi:hypothetical protein